MKCKTAEIQRKGDQLLKNIKKRLIDLTTKKKEVIGKIIQEINTIFQETQRTIDIMETSAGVIENNIIKVKKMKQK